MPRRRRVRRTVEYATAIVVGAAGDLIAPAGATDACRSITVPGLGNAERVAADATAGMALLRLYGARDLVRGTARGRRAKIATRMAT